MANEITKCPMCGTKLKMMNGRMTCKECGYYVRNDGEASGSSGTAQSGGSFSTGSSTTAGSADTRHQTTGQYSSSMRTGASGSSGSSPSRRPAEHNPTVAIVVGVIAGVVCVALFALIVLLKSGSLKDMLPDKEPGESMASSSTQKKDASPEASDETEAPTRGDMSSYYGLPQSSFFWSVAEYIWDKPCDTITEEEFASLTALQIDRDEKIGRAHV